jgi:hypothetical protein
MFNELRDDGSLRVPDIAEKMFHALRKTGVMESCVNPARNPQIIRTISDVTKMIPPQRFPTNKRERRGTLPGRMNCLEPLPLQDRFWMMTGSSKSQP